MCTLRQVYPPPRPLGIVASEILEMATDENSTVAQALASGDYQAAVMAIYSSVSILNVPLDFVRTGISCLITVFHLNVFIMHGSITDCYFYWSLALSNI